MIYHVIIRTAGKPSMGHGKPELPPIRTISGDAFEVIEWAAFHNMKYVEKFTDGELQHEGGFAVFTVQREDGKPLSKEELEIFLGRTEHLPQRIGLTSKEVEAHRNRLLGIADGVINQAPNLKEIISRY